MSRRMLMIGGIVLILLVGGAGLGIVYLKMNKPLELWVALPLSPQASKEQKEMLVKEWNEIANQEDVLRQVVQKENLLEVWGLASEDEAIVEIRERTSVDLYKDGQTMRILSKGIRQEKDLLNSTSKALFESCRDKYLKLHPEAAEKP